MYEVAIIKAERNGKMLRYRKKEFTTYDKARDFVRDFNKEDRGISTIYEYASVVVNF